MAYFSTYDSLLPFIVSDIPGIYDNIALQELKKAGIAFCRDTAIWKEILTPQNVVALQDTYTIDKPGTAEILDVFSIKLVSKDGDSFDNVQVQDSNYYKVSKTNSTIRFVDGSIPQTSITNGMQITMRFIPNVLAVGIPSWILNSYPLAIIAKVKMELMKQKGRVWFNAELAGYYKQEYLGYVAEARSDALKEFKNINTVIQYREFV